MRFRGIEKTSIRKRLKKMWYNLLLVAVFMIAIAIIMVAVFLFNILVEMQIRNGLLSERMKNEHKRKRT